MAHVVASRCNSLCRYFAAALHLMLVGLALSITATAQTLVVKSNGITISQGATLTINTIPIMPNLVLSVNGGSSCDTVSYNLDLSYEDRAGSTTQASYGSLDVPGDQSATINWFGLMEGGNATITWRFNGVDQQSSFDFFINGSNPSNGAVDAYASSGPWFVRNLIAWESRAWTLPPAGHYKQFDSVGYPLWGIPDGIGLLQLEDPNRNTGDQDFWSWPANVADGLTTLSGKQGAAYGSWNNEFNQMLSATSGGNPAHPPETAYVYCDFAYPQNGKDAYADGDWIHFFNGNYFIFFHPADSGGPNRWDIDTNGYVANVCNSAPL